MCDNQDYLAANYCPSQNDEQFCVDYLARYYIGMLVFTFTSTRCLYLKSMQRESKIGELKFQAAALV